MPGAAGLAVPEARATDATGRGSEDWIAEAACVAAPWPETWRRRNHLAKSPVATGLRSEQAEELFDVELDGRELEALACLRDECPIASATPVPSASSSCRASPAAIDPEILTVLPSRLSTALAA